MTILSSFTLIHWRTFLAGPSEFDRISQLLSDLHSWLLAAAFEPAVAVLLRGAGEALARSEHSVRSAGQVRYWPSEAVGALAALIKVFRELMERCPTTVGGSAGAAPVETGGTSVGVSIEAAVVSALVQLMVRSELIQLVVEALDLVHFDPSFSAPKPSSGRGGRSQTASSTAGNRGGHAAAVIAAALPMWNFLHAVVRFAGAHASEAGQSRESRFTETEFYLSSCGPRRYTT